MLNEIIIFGIVILKLVLPFKIVFNIEMLEIMDYLPKISLMNYSIIYLFCYLYLLLNYFRDRKNYNHYWLKLEWINQELLIINSVNQIFEIDLINNLIGIGLLSWGLMGVNALIFRWIYGKDYINTRKGLINFLMIFRPNEKYYLILLFWLRNLKFLINNLYFKIIINVVFLIFIKKIRINNINIIGIYFLFLNLVISILKLFWINYFYFVYLTIIPFYLIYYYYFGWIECYQKRKSSLSFYQESNDVNFQSPV